MREISYSYFPSRCEIHRINPRGLKSGSRKSRVPPIPLHTASAARCPDRAALSIVDGHPVAVQSPARKQFGHGDTAPGRAASISGGTPNVARTSFTTAAFSSFACAASGKNSLSSLTAFSIACSRVSAAKLRDALTSNSI